MNYRLATIADREELVRLRMEMRREIDKDFQPEPLSALTRDFFQRNLPSGRHVAFVCENEGQLIADVGITLFEMMPTPKSPNGRTARMMNMYVAPPYRQRGIAKTLLKIAVKYARETGCARITLNPSVMGMPLYLNFGFQKMDNEYEYPLK